MCFNSSSVASTPRTGKATVTSRCVFRYGQQELWLYCCGYFSLPWCFGMPGLGTVTLSPVVEFTESKYRNNFGNNLGRHLGQYINIFLNFPDT